MSTSVESISDTILIRDQVGAVLDEERVTFDRDDLHLWVIGVPERQEGVVNNVEVVIVPVPPVCVIRVHELVLANEARHRDATLGPRLRRHGSFGESFAIFELNNVRLGAVVLKNRASHFSDGAADEIVLLSGERSRKSDDMAAGLLHRNLQFGIVRATDPTATEKEGQEREVARAPSTALLGVRGWV